MNEKVVKKQLRREFGKSGVALLVYYILMNVAVAGICIAEAVVKVFVLGSGTQEQLFYVLSDSLMNNGWGYLTAILIGWLLALVWKKKEFCFHEIWKTEKAMNAGAFWKILVVFLGVQWLLQIWVMLVESLLNMLGLTAISAIESASGGVDTVSMFLYICLGAPIAEEILFRGLLLRSLKPYGKGFAIFSTAFLFGIFHGNLVQTPFAFLVGLILGYVAVEYSVGWSMVLHMVNNLVLGDTLPRLLGIFAGDFADGVLSLAIFACGIAGIVILCRYRQQIRAYLRGNRMHPWCVKAFFTSAGIIVLTVLMLANMAMGISSL